MSTASSNNNAVKFLVYFFVFLAFWSLGWYYAGQEGWKRFDKLIAKEAAHGRNLNCQQRETTGYPFQLALTCRQLSWNDPERKNDINLASVTAKFVAWAPDQISFHFSPPFIGKFSSPNIELEIVWSSAQIIKYGILTQSDSEDVEISTPSFALAGHGDTPFAKGEAIMLTQTLDAPIDTKSFRLNMVGFKSGLPDLKPTISSPIDLKVEGSISHASLLEINNAAQALENWRSAAGLLKLSDVDYHRDDVHVTAAGHLAIDTAHQPDGIINLSIVGAKSIGEQLGLPSGPVGALAIIGQLSKKAPITTEPAPSAGASAISLSVKLQGGKASIGSMAIPVPPLY